MGVEESNNSVEKSNSQSKSYFGFICTFAIVFASIFILLTIFIGLPYSSFTYDEYWGWISWLMIELSIAALISLFTSSAISEVLSSTRSEERGNRTVNDYC